MYSGLESVWGSAFSLRGRFVLALGFVLIAGFLGVADQSLANGTWSVTSQGTWMQGSGSNIDPFLCNNSIITARNWDDSFTYSGGNYDPLPSYWNCEFGNGWYEKTSAPGYLRLVSGSQHTEWWNVVDTAPKVFQAIGGDCIVETSASFPVSIHNYGMAALFMRQDSLNWVTVGIDVSLQGYKYSFQQFVNGELRFEKKYAGTTLGKFRLVKTGNSIQGLYLSGTIWVDMGAVATNWHLAAAGIFMKDTTVDNSYANFDYVYFSTTRTYSASGYYESQVFDLTAVPSSQGTISWGSVEPIDSSIEIRTRTSSNNSSWSTWSSAYGSSGSEIVSPLARYMQFSARLMENSFLDSPKLNEVVVSYPGIPPMAPEVSATGYVTNLWGNSDPVDVSWVNPSGNPVPISAFGFSLDGALISGTKFDSGAVVVSTTVTGTRFAGLADGRHFVRVAAQGEPIEYLLSSEIEFMVLKDTVPPAGTAITSGTHPAAEEVDNNNPVFRLSSADVVSTTTMISGVEGWYHVLDRDSYTQPGPGNAFSSTDEVSFKGLENGTWWFHARAKDGAGNLGTTGHYPIRVNFRGSILDESRVHAVPHPIRGNSAAIRYDLAAPAQEVRMTVLDSSGRIVGRMEGGTAPGVNETAWDTSGLANGVYFCRIVVTQEGKKTTVVKKLAVVK